jgi:NDP-sugar pyrophosphorylase family protein
VVIGFAPKGQAQGTWHFVGVQIVRKALFEHLPDGKPAETIAGFYRDIVAREPGRVRVWPVGAPFVDVGTPADYLRAVLATGSNVIAAAALGDHQPARRPVTIDRSRRTVLWPDVVLDSSAELNGVVAAGAVAIPPGFSATNAVIVPATVMRPHDRAMVHGDLAVFPFESGPSSRE